MDDDQHDYMTEEEWARVVDAGSSLIAADMPEHEVDVGREHTGKAVRLLHRATGVAFYGIVREDGWATVRRA